MDFEDKRVIVTGGSSGIGLALAHAFAKGGASVFITGRRAKALQEAAAGHPGLVPVVCDVTVDDQVIALKEKVDAAGGADVLVNNAGVMAFFDILDGYPLEEQIKEVAIDAIGPIRMIHHFLPALLERDTTIINVSSGIAYVPFAKARSTARRRPSCTPTPSVSVNSSGALRSASSSCCPRSWTRPWPKGSTPRSPACRLSSSPPR